MNQDYYIDNFWKSTRDYYQNHQRDMPWREPEPNGSFDAYKILVSELMLQQTQVPRVIPKYREFVAKFPNVHSLAKARLSEVIKAWSGLGYNRRAKYLHEAAKYLAVKPQPWKYEDLLTLKGIGPNTTAAICVYAYNEPRTFIETNIRTVYIHHFFADQSGIADKDILSLLEQTLDRKNPREFYWALMDYGTYLKTSIGNLSQKSKTYAKQSTFKGSNRQIRGQVLKLLTSGPHTLAELKHSIKDERLETVLVSLVNEGFIDSKGATYRLC